jgi:2-dehydro-3-deoxygluconokinase
MAKVLCFGELLMRLSPRLNGEWIKEHSMPVFIGGAELNAATALSNWNVPVSYCTALPDNYLSREILQHVNDRGIETDRVVYTGNRIGAYYLPQGADMKAAGVIYDRAHSSFWDLQPGQVDWDRVLDGITWFHFSAISPALNTIAAAVCLEAVQAAAQKGITVSVDLNYRAKLWQYGKTPVEVMPELVGYCDVVMGNIWAAEKMLGIPVPAGITDRKEAYLQEAEKTSKIICKTFTKCRSVANTFRFDAGEGVRYYATLYDGSAFFVSPEQYTQRIIDKVGSGDTFMAGLIYGHIKEHGPQEIIDFAAAAAFNKLFIKGDASTSTVEEIIKTNPDYA